MNKKLFIKFGIFILAALLLWLILDLIIPAKLTTINPATDQKLIGTDTNIELGFNKKVYFNKITITINPNTSYKTLKKGKNITFDFNDNLKANKTYEIRLTSQRNFVYQDKKTKTVSWQFTTGADVAEIIANMNFGDFYDKYPLDRFTPYETSHFLVEWPDEQGITTITLYAVFNAGVNGPPIEEQEAVYKNELKTYKKEALDWIRSNGIDPNTVKIKWIPEKAANY